jgi:RNA polymerase sigma-70 factor, ECF subfamily
MALRQESKLIQSHIKEVISGKSSAYEQLYRNHAGRIYTFGLKFFNHNRQAAEELTERVFIKAYEEINSYPEKYTFILWLRKIAVGEIRKGEIQISGEVHQASPTDEAIYSLPEDERLIFILSDVDKLSTEEILEITEESSEDANKKLDHSRQTIMEKVQVDTLQDLDRKINFVAVTPEPRDELWKMIYNEIHSIATKDFEEKPGGEILNVGDAKLTVGEKFQKIKEKEKKKAVYFKSVGFSINRKLIFTVILSVLVAAAIFFLFFFNTTEWQVVNMSGSPAIKAQHKSRTVESTTLLETNEILVTSRNSKAVIKIPGMGELIIYPGSSIKRINEKGELLINNGDIDIVKNKDSDPFPVEIMSAKVEDYKAGSYSIKTDYKKAVITSQSAGLIINSDDREVYLLPGYVSEIRARGKVGIPYSTGASTEYVYAVNNFSFEGKEDKINLILVLSEKKDALTLFNLLKLVDKEYRDQIINKLHSLVSLPKDVNPRQMSNLKEDDLEKWLDSIEKVI